MLRWWLGQGYRLEHLAAGRESKQSKMQGAKMRSLKSDHISAGPGFMGLRTRLLEINALTVNLYADELIWQYRDDHPGEWQSYGCGPGGLGDFLVPDTMWGLSVREACRIHDGYYRHWPESIEAARERADLILRNNCIRIIDAAFAAGVEAISRRKYKLEWCRQRALKRQRWLYEQRLERAQLYYVMVRRFGGPAYFDDWRNSERELKAVAIA